MNNTHFCTIRTILFFLFFFQLVGIQKGLTSEVLVKEADALISEQKYSAALEKIKRAIDQSKLKKDEMAWAKLVVKEAQLQMGLHGYETAVKDLKRRQWPDKPLAEAMVNIAYASSLKNYFESYSWEIRKRERVESKDEVDLKAWTGDQIYLEAYKAYSKVWKNRTGLAKYPKSKMPTLIQANTYPEDIRGTLRDSLTFLFAELLADSSGWTPQQSNEKYLLNVGQLYKGEENLSLTDPKIHPLRKISYIFSDLENWHKSEKKQGPALEARIELIRIIYSQFTDKLSKAIGIKVLNQAIEKNKNDPWVTMAYATLAKFTSQEIEPDAMIRAMAIAQKGAALFSNSPGAAKCRDFIKSIERPQYSLIGMDVDGVNKRSIQISYQNISKVTFKSYAFDIKTFLKNTQDYSIRPTWREIESQIKTKSIYEWSVSLPPTLDYRSHSFFVTPPTHKPGFYIIMANEEKTGLQTGVQMYFSDLVLTVHKDYFAKKIQVDVLSGKSGEALKDVTVSLYKADYQKAHSMIGSEKTNKDGSVSFIRSSAGGENLFVIAEKGDQLVSSQSPFYIYNQAQQDHQTRDAFIYTDRSIYRPDQKVKWKIVAYKGDVKEVKYAVDPKAEVTVYLRDTSSQVIQKTTVTTNKYGSASGEFIIPQGKLLGQWNLYSSHGGMSYIKVEEYKRPTFEVEVADKSTSMRLNHSATVEGKAKYYFGLPVTSGSIRWSVERTPVLPWWCFWGRWNWDSIQSSQVIATGSSELKQDGTFIIKFIPKGDERLATEIEGLKYNYKMNIDVTDEGGETRSTSSNYTVGFSAVTATISQDRNFFLKDSKPVIKISRTDLNGKAAKGIGKWRVSLLKQPSETLSPSELPIPSELKKLSKKDFKNPDDLKQTRWASQFSPEIAMREWPVNNQVSGGTLKEGEDQPEIPSLISGAYRLDYETVDAYGTKFETSKDFLVIDKNSSIQLPGYFAVEKNSVEVGDTIRLFAASGFKNQRMIFEIYKANKLFKTDFITSGGRLIEIPVNEADRGGMGFTFRLLHDHQEVKFSEAVLVPWSNKELKIEFATFRDKIRPDSKEKWSIRLLGPDKNNLTKAHEVLAYMYDRSLDSFTPHTPPSPLGIYPTRTGTSYPDTGLGMAQIVYYPHGNNYTQPEFKYLAPDQIIFYPNYGIGGPGSRGGMDSMKGGGRMMLAKGAMSNSAMMAESAMESAPASSPQKKSKSDKTETADALPSTKTPEIRTNFSETAFWKPHLTSDKDGNIKIEFEVPDSVTSWNVWVHAITNDLISGKAHKETRSVKELMVRPYLPRFFREGDEADIKVVINNSSEKELSGTLEFDILDTETQLSIASDFKLVKEDNKRTFKVKPQSSSNLTYKIKAPSRPGPIAVKVVAKAGNLSDGEIRPLPVLPGRFHLAQSRFVTLNNKDKREITFEDLIRNDDPSRINNLMVVTLDAQLFYSVLSSLPFIIKYPYESTEQVMNSFISTGILTSVFDQFPSVKAMAKDFSSRKTQLESWADNDPNIKMVMEETPWLAMSKGGDTVEKDLIAVLNPEKAKELRIKSLKFLEGSQTSLGGFPWFAGGPPSLGITLSILYGFSKAIEFGVEVPKAMVVKAWSYMHRYYIDELVTKVMVHDCCAEVITFMNYIISNYPDASWTGNVFTEADKKKMLDFSFRQWKTHSPYMKGYLTLTLNRANRKDDAKLVWDSVMDSAKTSKDEGTHWAQEDRSWLWYNDTIETHAMALRTGSEVGTKEDVLDGVVQWLFLNKKLNHWKSTRATSEVIYSLTHYLKKTNQLGVKENVEVKLGGESHSFEFDSAKYTGKKNQVIIPAQKISSSLLPIKIEKSSLGHLFASATWHYSTEKLPSEARGDFFSVNRSYFKRVKNVDGYKLLPINDGTLIEVGDEVEVQLSLTSKHQAEYVHLRDPRAAGFEPSDSTSKHKWDLGLVWYEEIRDSATNFFFEYLPKGQYTFKYRMRAATSGKFKTSPATVQPLYAPEFVGFSTGTFLKVDGMK